MRIRVFVFIFISLGFVWSGVSAQNLSPDSSQYTSVAIRVIDYFNSIIADRSELYNGPVYELYPPANKGSFYFRDKNYCVPSLIHYNGTWYKNVPLLYDIHNDLMISTSGDYLFALSTERITDVYLLNHHFIYLNAKKPASPASGFYDELYNGKSQILVKRTKLIDDHTIASTQAIEVFYTDKSDVYLKKGNSYILVNTRVALEEAFKDKKKEIKQYIKDNKIDFKADGESAAVKLANYYDTISK